MRYHFVAAHAAVFDVAVMCRLLSLSRSGYYAWRARAPSRRAAADLALRAAIEALFARSRQTNGSPRVHAELRARGVRCGRHRVARLMRAAGWVARGHRAGRRTTRPGSTHWRIPDLVRRQFHVARPNTIWASDITFITTADGWLYLAVVLDLASRRVVGWAMHPTLSEQLVLHALEMALVARRPPAGTVHHSDRGAQYTSLRYQTVLAAHGLVPSVGRAGSCYDNAVVESFFHTLKRELLTGRGFRDRDAARTAVFEYLELWYNRQRRHSTLGYETPMQFEEQYIPV